jgi:hypothetical protein
MTTIADEIQYLKLKLSGAKPRSARRHAIEGRLFVLRMKQLKQEIRAEKRKAA